MGFLDKAKAAAEQATTRAKEGVDEVQAKRALTGAYEDLGRTTFALMEAGEVSHAGLDGQAAAIRELNARLESDAPAPADAPAETEAATPGA